MCRALPKHVSVRGGLLAQHRGYFPDFRTKERLVSQTVKNGVSDWVIRPEIVDVVLTNFSLGGGPVGGQWRRTLFVIASPTGLFRGGLTPGESVEHHDSKRKDVDFPVEPLAMVRYFGREVSALGGDHIPLLYAEMRDTDLGDFSGEISTEEDGFSR